MASDTLAQIPYFVSLSSCSDSWLKTLTYAESIAKRAEQTLLLTHHVLHGGMYARTITMPEGTVLFGALLRIPTLLIVEGACMFRSENGDHYTNGYSIIPGSKGRKTLAVALSKVSMTMIFPTQARTVDEAEREFTDDWASLMSRQSLDDTVVVTGE